ncbi:hypothetical protein SBF1_5250002 [Candidatus Desulfosporosinus infrequens]|uniref:Uncharacterized protein n=1 Tax=Candidatus Desulfosporosinus infrequens TaxID=2043169 RepID=A0A2U3LIJ2_9FIRM|nr:hypothetical protein SBF1_5250002 [Candidatus Desulfosporosinus infrequens]
MINFNPFRMFIRPTKLIMMFYVDGLVYYRKAKKDNQCTKYYIAIWNLT